VTSLRGKTGFVPWITSCHYEEIRSIDVAISGFNIRLQQSFVPRKALPA